MMLRSDPLGEIRFYRELEYRLVWDGMNGSGKEMGCRVFDRSRS